MDKEIVCRTCKHVRLKASGGYRACEIDKSPFAWIGHSPDDTCQEWEEADWHREKRLTDDKRTG